MSVNIARLQEDITRGQSVSKYSIYGASDDSWRVLSRGTTIGYTKLDRFSPVSVHRVKLVIEDSFTAPEPVVLKLYRLD